MERHSVHGLEGQHFKNDNFSKLTYKLYASAIKILATIFVSKDKIIPKCIKKCKGTRTCKMILK